MKYIDIILNGITFNISIIPQGITNRKEVLLYYKKWGITYIPLTNKIISLKEIKKSILYFIYPEHYGIFIKKMQMYNNFYKNISIIERAVAAKKIEQLTEEEIITIIENTVKKWTQ